MEAVLDRSHQLLDVQTDPLFNGQKLESRLLSLRAVDVLREPLVVEKRAILHGTVVNDDG